MKPQGIDAVLFDLDGTLADTAPDLAAALNRLLIEEGKSPLPLAEIRPYTSAGTRGLLGLGFGIDPADHDYPGFAERFLNHYAVDLCVATELFPGIVPLLQQLEAARIAWGVVTNKPQRFTLPLLAKLGLDRRCACIVSGDSTPTPKPHPASLLLGCRHAGAKPERSIYVGDDLRDIEAGRSAGMFTIAAGWGYLGKEGAPETWHADAIISTPGGVWDILLKRQAC